MPSRNLNPEISVNGLFLGRVGTSGSMRTQERANGFHMQEVETRLTASVDPYFRSEFTLAIEKEPGEEFEVRPEEAFAETLALPRITLKVGKFKTHLGKHNLYHTHAFPFVDQPLIYDFLLGEEGLNEIGIGAALLVPTPWFAEIVLQGLSAGNENLFDTDDADDLAGVFLLRNLWDLNDATTLELIGTYGFGENDLDGLTQLYNGALTLKWKPTTKTIYRSFSWTTEFLQTHRGNSVADRRVGGMSSWIQWLVARRWWLQGRLDHVGLPAPNIGSSQRYSVLIAFAPSEYSALRLQYDALDEAGGDRVEHFVTLQLNITIGSHPAHAY